MSRARSIEERFSEAIRLQREGRLAEAEAIYLDLLSEDPTLVSVFNNLGMLRYSQAEWESAALCFEAALSLVPNHSSALLNLGSVSMQRGRLEDACRLYAQACALDLNAVAARQTLGKLLRTLGKPRDAILVLEEAIALEPTNGAIAHDLAQCFRAGGDETRAIEWLEKATALEPTNALLLEELATVLYSVGRHEDAAHRLEQAVALRPSPEALTALGTVLVDLGDTGKGLTAISRGLSLAPDRVESLLPFHLALPVVYESESEIQFYRRRYEEGLTALLERTRDPGTAKALLAVVAAKPNFYLAYQGQNDLPLQRSYGELLRRSVQHLPQYEKKRGPRGRIRIGYLSSFFRDHSVGRMTLGLVTERDRNAFELYTYHLGQYRQPLTDVYEQESDVFRHLPEDFERIFPIVRNDDLDILVFADIGMDPRSGILAALRLAPVQCVYFGHPVTTGIPSVDYFITCGTMEPTGADSHYSEKLVRLSGIGECQAARTIPGNDRVRSDFGFDHSDIVYLSSQVVQKYLPGHDDIYACIAKEEPRARFAFLEHPHASRANHKFKTRLHRAFERVGAPMDRHVRFFPHLRLPEYFALLRSSDVFLDNPSWSGGNTALDAFACSIPAVTLPGSTMRSRHVLAMLTELGLPEWVASSEEDYVRLALTLGRDRALRDHVRDILKERVPSTLFNRVDCVREAEAAFLKMLT